jgi:cytochrome c oxidase subunit 2
MKALSRILMSLACVALLAGCEGVQSTLNPAGAKATQIDHIFRVFLGVSVVVWLLVVVFLAAALLRERVARLDPLGTDPRQERRLTVIVSIFVALTAATLVVLTAVSYAGQRSLFGPHAEGVTIRVIGHQFWWELRYEEPENAKSFVTANEMHIPVGEPVNLKLEASDVIHSLWMPNISGKEDLIPGRQNILQIRADREGAYRGQCAEFCGYQHAHMGLVLFAEPRKAYDRWRAEQVSGRAEPADDLHKKGETVFLTHACIMCHTVRGTSAGSNVGPDLTHVGARSTIAAATLPMNAATLAAWIADPQGVKPGAKMPKVKLEADDLNALAAYLEGLK